MGGPNDLEGAALPTGSECYEASCIRVRMTEIK